ncbi:MAG: DUF3572 family protein [Alphaproteobacteria bacterium]|nr:DUF3572 family protein [Alphaproteobacteria bacterium]
MKRQQAEQIAERALTFLANRPPVLQQFLTASGLDASELIARADDADIRSAVLGFVAGDESLAKEFSEETDLKPGQLLQICAVLDPHGSTSW